MTRATRLARALALLPVILAGAGCQPNPRTEIGAVAEAALAELQRTSPGHPFCVERTIAPWQTAIAARRRDPPAPPGFAGLYDSHVFRGGGGLKGAAVGAAIVRGGAGCVDLRGPLIDGDKAMVEVHLPGIGWNVWLHRVAGDWRVVMTTTSSYSG